MVRRDLRGGGVMMKFRFLKLLAAAGLALAAPAFAQSSAPDPNDRGEYEPAARPSAQAQPAAPVPVGQVPWGAPIQPVPVQPVPLQPVPVQQEYQPLGAPVAIGPAAPVQDPTRADASARASAAVGTGLSKHKVLQAAEGVFGRGAEGLAGLLETILRKQGEPTAYITGSEAGGAVVVGLRYGRGMLHHKLEGDRQIFWTGPTIGFDFGADANKVFVLVYNLDKGDQLFTRFPAAEGHAYVVGGLTASYLRRGNTVLIPIRTGVGMRLGVNAGYMRFSKKNKWVPF